MALTNPELLELDELATNLVERAGKALLERFRSPLAIEYKNKQTRTDPVTEADRAIEQLVLEELTRQVPDHGIVAEETGQIRQSTSPLTWVIDPLDGTTNYMNGLPIFSCSIGLLHEGIPVVGAIFLPWPSNKTMRILHAHTGGGTWDGETKVTVSQHQKAEPSEIVVLSGIGRNWYWKRNGIRSIPGERRSVGSIAYELALVADGTYQYALFSSPRSWDVAAGIVLIKEARGQALQLNLPDSEWIPFEGFDTRNKATKSKQTDLQSWNRPILVGNHHMVTGVTDYLQSSNNLVDTTINNLKRAFSSQKG